MAGWMDDAEEVAMTDKDRAAFAKAPALLPASAPPSEDDIKAIRDRELQRRIDARPAYDRSFAAGAKQGLTASFGDELAGTFGALGNVYGRARDAVTGYGGSDEGFLESTRSAYRQARDEERTRLDESRAAEPLKTGAGQVLSSLLLPAGAAGKASDLGKAVLTGMGVGALQGVVTGAGEAKTLEPQDVVGEMTKTGLLGLLTGGAAPVALQAVKSAGPAVAQMVARPLKAHADGADVARLATAKGATGGNIEGLKMQRLVEGKVSGTPPVKGGTAEAARVMREYGMAPAASTTSGLAERAASTRSTVNEAKRMLLEQADAAGASVSSEQLAQRVRQRARALLADSDEYTPVVETMLDHADELAAGGKTYTLDEVARKANVAGKVAGKWGDSPAQVLAKQEYIRALRDTADDAVEAALVGVPPSEVTTMITRLRGSPGPKNAKELYQELRKVEQVARLVEDQAAESLGRAAGNRALGLREGQAAELGAQVMGGAGPAGAAGAAVSVGLLKAASARGAQARATAKEAAGRAAKRLESLIEAPPTAAPARASGAVGASVLGAREGRFTATTRTSADQMLAEDLRRRGMSEEEIASFLGEVPDDVGDRLKALEGL